LQSALTRDEYHLIQESTERKNEKEIEDLYSRFGYRNILSQQPNYTTKTSFFEVFQGIPTKCGWI
jgi:peptide methionine sulfoxide reductase MsrB